MNRSPAADNEVISIILLAHNEAATIQREIGAFYEEVIRWLPGVEFIVAASRRARRLRFRLR